MTFFYNRMLHVQVRRFIRSPCVGKNNYNISKQTRCSWRWQTLPPVPPPIKLDEAYASSLIVARSLYYVKTRRYPQNWLTELHNILQCRSILIQLLTLKLIIKSSWTFQILMWSVISATEWYQWYDVISPYQSYHSYDHISHHSSVDRANHRSSSSTKVQ